MTHIAENPRYSCALGGALTTVKAFHRVIPVLHCGPGCGMMLYNGQNFVAGYSGGGYVGGATVPSTNTYEREIVFGGEQRLRQVLASTLEVMDGDLYFVLTGCTADIIGDDVAAVTGELATARHPILHAATAGFKGTGFQGYELVWEAVVRQLLKPARSRKTRLVNLFGIVPAQDVFWQGNLDEIARLLRRLGLEVNTFVTERQGVDEIRQSARAALNIFLSPWLATTAEQLYAETLGVPALRYPGLPVGPTATTEFLRQVAARLNVNARLLKRVIAEEEQVVYDQFDKAAMVFTGFGIQHRLAVIGDTNYALGITRFLVNDLSQIPAVVIITDEPPETARAGIRSALEHLEYAEAPEILFAADQWTIADAVRNAGATGVLGSSLDKEVAQEIAAVHQSVTFPITDRLVLNRALAGYRGGITLVEDFISPCLAPL